MIVYRITTAKWASRLAASGYPARWNPRNVYVIYTAGSRALACLENLVHRSGEGLHANFRIVEISIHDSVSIEKISVTDLPLKWNLITGYPACQEIGKEWVNNQSSCVLRVPSSIIEDEFNFLINPFHPEFNLISIRNIQEFTFDERLKSITD